MCVFSMARCATRERERQKQWKRVKMRGRWNQGLRQARLEPFKNTLLDIISNPEMILIYGRSWLKTHHSKNKDHGIRSHHLMANRWGSNGNSERLFSWAPKSLWIVTAAMELKYACSLEEKLQQT